VGFCAIAAGGCQNKLHDENEALWKQNRELQQQLTESQNRNRNAPPPSDPNQVAQLQADIQQRDAKIAELQSQLNKPSPNTPPEDSNLLKGIEVTKDSAAGTVTVNLPGDVLFASGSSDLKPSARTTLDKVVAAIKKDYPGKKVVVQGYTDTDPIARTKDKWKDNLDLSAARARTVKQYLVGQGLSEKQVGLQAYGDTAPKGNKDRSRRVEIVVSTL
jgi:outer membrane protein OmpA-like peptidoglycan-associated protein